MYIDYLLDKERNNLRLLSTHKISKNSVFVAQDVPTIVQSPKTQTPKKQPNTISENESNQPIPKPTLPNPKESRQEKKEDKEEGKEEAKNQSKEVSEEVKEEIGREKSKEKVREQVLEQVLEHTEGIQTSSREEGKEGNRIEAQKVGVDGRNEEVELKKTGVEVKKAGVEEYVPPTIEYSHLSMLYFEAIG